MAEIRRGEVYYINRTDDEIGSEQYSGRPAIIVSNNQNNTSSGTVEVVYLTTQPKKDLPTHVFISATLGIPRDSIALCEQITTVSVARLGNFICVLPRFVMSDINKAMMVSLGIPTEECGEEIEEEIEIEVAEEYTERERELIYKVKGMIYKDLYHNLLDKIIK